MSTAPNEHDEHTFPSWMVTNRRVGLARKRREGSNFANFGIGHCERNQDEDWSSSAESNEEDYEHIYLPIALQYLNEKRRLRANQIARMPVRQAAPGGLERSQTEISDRRPSNSNIYELRGQVKAAVQCNSPPNHFRDPAMMGARCRVRYNIHLSHCKAHPLHLRHGLSVCHAARMGKDNLPPIVSSKAHALQFNLSTGNLSSISAISARKTSGRPQAH